MSIPFFLLVFFDELCSLIELKIILIKYSKHFFGMKISIKSTISIIFLEYSFDIFYILDLY